MSYQISVYSDGGARGNPGPAGIGAVIQVKSSKLKVKSWQIKKFIGIATNNQAEYLALIFALEKVLKIETGLGFEISGVKCYLDSQLLVCQLNGEYKVKDLKLAKLFFKVCQLQQKLGQVKFIYIPRKQNKQADKLVNQAIDGKKLGNICSLGIVE